MPTVLFVSHLARPENSGGLAWFLREAWPQVRAAVPDAELRVAGAGADGELTALVAQSPGVRLLGFVRDLEPEYAAAHVVVVPLQFGAGVKLKTVEALLRGVPVVATPVGAEGIGEASWYAGLSPHASDLGDAVVAVLRDPASHDATARRTQELARTAYGQAAFADAIRDAYGWRATDTPRIQ